MRCLLDRPGWYVYQVGDYYLTTNSGSKDGYTHKIVSDRLQLEYPLNETAASIWKCCSKVTSVEDLLQEFKDLYPDVTDMGKEFTSVLHHLHELNVVAFSSEPYRTKLFQLNYLLAFKVLKVL